MAHTSPFSRFVYCTEARAEPRAVGFRIYVCERTHFFRVSINGARSRGGESQVQSFSTIDTAAYLDIVFFDSRNILAVLRTRCVQLMHSLYDCNACFHNDNINGGENELLLLARAFIIDAVQVTENSAA